MPEIFYQTSVPTAEFARRRHELAVRMESGTALLRGAPSSGAFDLFRQYNDFYYLSGVECPHAYMTIDAGSGRTTLYLLPTDAKLAESEGAELSCTFPEETCRLTGCDEVKEIEALAADLKSAETIWVLHDPQEGRQACQDTLRLQDQLWRQDRWRPASEPLADIANKLAPSAKVCDLSPMLRAMRWIKSDVELEHMAYAGQLTGIAVAEAMRCTQPGMIEGQLRAVADYVFVLNGASSGGYRPIIAGGENIWNIHYYRNNAKLVAGDLVLMDYAPDYASYTSDIGRMWPVSGTYEPWQRELYGVIVDYHLALLDTIQPGLTHQEVRDKAAAKLAPTVNRTRWMRPTFEEAVHNLLYVTNPLTHGVGMAVHEGPGYHEGTLEPGVVFALDPQLWVRPEQLYIRVEDTVAVTPTGVQNLTGNCPHQLDEVIELMREPGLTDLRPDLFASR